MTYWLCLLLVMLATVYFPYIASKIRGWRRLYALELQNIEPVKTFAHKITVIVAARNEARNLDSLLNGLRDQTIDKSMYEVYLVNDHSTDNTLETAQAFALNNSGFKLKVLNRNTDDGFSNYKKGCIEMAISLCHSDIIVTTDADCIHHPNWLKAMLASMEQQNARMITGPVKFASDGSFFQNFQQIEFALINAIGAAGIGNNKPVLSNGANLMYYKADFESLGGFEGNSMLASGDDEFLMNKMIANKYKVGFAFNSFAIVETKPNATLYSFIQQRLRWASKTNKYQSGNSDLIVIGFMSLILTITFMAVLLLDWYKCAYFAVFLGLKYCIDVWFLIHIESFYGLVFNKLSFAIMQPFHFLYVTYVAFVSRLKPQYVWKNRKLS
jgi:cellulose synthase/poly-beta-1,6-N-acetylglucosamine synthase-like glycosyltransferase